MVVQHHMIHTPTSVSDSLSSTIYAQLFTVINPQKLCSRMAGVSLWLCATGSHIGCPYLIEQGAKEFRKLQQRVEFDLGAGQSTK